jgi:hypothetical protein
MQKLNANAMSKHEYARRNFEKLTATTNKQISIIPMTMSNFMRKTFREHLDVQPKHWEASNQHHQLKPNQEYDDCSNMVLPDVDLVGSLQLVALRILKRIKVKN